MSAFVDGFCSNLGTEFSAAQIISIRDRLEVFSMGYEIHPITTEIVPGTYTLPQELKLFLATKQQDGKMSTRSYEQYYSCLSRMLFDLAMPLNAITVNHLRMHIARISTDKRTGKPLSQTTIDQRKSIIRSFFKWLYEEEYIEKNPAVRIKPVRPDSKPREAYQDTQIETLRDACVTLRDRAIVDMLTSSGIRISECVGLNKTDVDLKNRQMTVFGKGGKYRTVYIDARTVVSLKKYLDDRADDKEALFVGNREPHERITTSGVRKVLHRIEDKTDVQKVIPHRFRHTMATRALTNGMPVESIQALLGHSNISTTMRYAHMTNAKAKRDHDIYMH